MSCKVEKIGNDKAKFTIDVDSATFKNCEDKVFNREKGKLSIPGFRKGKVSKDVVYKFYGRNVFLEDAANECINDTYYDEVNSTGEKVLSKPKITITKIEPDQNFVYEVEVAIMPEVKLPSYKGIPLKKTQVTVTDEDVDKKIKEEQEKNSRLVSVDRKSKMGDVLNIDFEGFVDGKPFKGGKAEKYSLTLGSHSFIDNFEDQLVDKAVGEDVDVHVKFPDNYQEKSLAGKEALFKCKVNEVKEKQLPEIDDEFVSEISEFDKLDDYKADVKKKIQEQKEKAAKEDDKGRLLDEIAKNTKLDLADEAIEYQIDGMIENYDNRLRYQGIDFENYLKMMGKTMEEYRKEARPNAEQALKNSIILEQIAKNENIEVTDAMVDEELTLLAHDYGMEPEQFKKSYSNPEYIKRLKADLFYPAILNFIYDNAKLS